MLESLISRRSSDSAGSVCVVMVMVGLGLQKDTKKRSYLSEHMIVVNYSKGNLKFFRPSSYLGITPLSSSLIQHHVQTDDSVYQLR